MGEFAFTFLASIILPYISTTCRVILSALLLLFTFIVKLLALGFGKAIISNPFEISAPLASISAFCVVLDRVKSEFIALTTIILFTPTACVGNAASLAPNWL